MIYMIEGVESAAAEAAAATTPLGTIITHQQYAGYY